MVEKWYKLAEGKYNTFVNMGESRWVFSQSLVYILRIFCGHAMVGWHALNESNLVKLVEHRKPSFSLTRTQPLNAHLNINFYRNIEIHIFPPYITKWNGSIPHSFLCWKTGKMPIVRRIFIVIYDICVHHRFNQIMRINFLKNTQMQTGIIKPKSIHKPMTETITTTSKRTNTTTTTPTTTSQATTTQKRSTYSQSTKWKTLAVVT